MLKLLNFALKNLRTKLTRAVLASLAIILCATIALVSYNTAKQVQDGVISTAGFYDTIVGPEGSPLQLALATMFFVENPLGTIPYEHYEKLRHNPAVREIYPFAAGDFYRTTRIIGTVPAYLQRYELQEGRIFAQPGEAVIGYQVARSGILRLDDVFVGAHGFAVNGHIHDDFEYRVVGVLAKSRTAADNVIFTPIESVWLVHADHDHEHADHDHEHGHEDTHDYVHGQPEGGSGEGSSRQDGDMHGQEAGELKGDLVSIMLRTESLAAHARLVAAYREIPGVQAINPASVLRELLVNLTLGRDILYALAAIIMFMAAIVIYVTTASFVEDSKKDLLIMRLVGIKRKTIVPLFVLQTVFLAAVSMAVSFFLSFLALLLINRFTAANFGLVIDGAKRYPAEMLILLVIFVIIVVSSLVSIFPVYRHDPLEGRS